MNLADHYSLSFLDCLGSSPSEQEIEAAWHGRVFPLVRLADFQANWVAKLDPAGLFLDSAGSRCRVDARLHHSENCKVKIRAHDGTSRPAVISYEAIVFAKVAYQLHLKGVSAAAQRPPEVEYRRFVDSFVSKLPMRWREVIVHCSLHLWGDQQGPQGTQPVYRHRSLSQPTNIRLLKLLPAQSFWSPLECTLTESDRSPSTQYEALSYVWGKQSPSVTILLDGIGFSVGENLEGALRQLRPRIGTPRVMWIDAICIDQTNMQERAQQVSQMDDIYRSAAGVVVWLGPETNLTSALFRSVLYQSPALTPFKSQVLRNAAFLFENSLEFPFVTVEAKCWGPHTRQRPCVQKYVTPEGVVPREMVSLLNRTRELAFDIALTVKTRLAVLYRPWWRRVWVLQELVLGTKVTVQCGPKSLDWLSLQSTLFVMARRDTRGLFAQLSSPTSHQQLFYLRELQTEIWKVFPFFFLQKSSPLANRVGDVTMAQLVALTHEFEATDPRDKVFALVGLLPTNSQERFVFAPDYSIGTRRLCVRAAKYWLETTQTLDVISAWDGLHKTSEGDRMRESVLPSWVPDLTRPQEWRLRSIWIKSFSPHKTVDEYLAEVQLRAKQRSQTPKPDDQEVTPASTAFARLQLYNASLHSQSPFPLEFAALDEVFLPRGVTLDRISDIGPELQIMPYNRPGGKQFERGSHRQIIEETETLKTKLMGIIESWKSVANLQGRNSYPLAKQSCCEAFWRTLLLDRYQSEGGAGKLLQLCRIPQNVETDKGWEYAGIHIPPRDQKEERILALYICLSLVQSDSLDKVNLHSMLLSFFRTEKGYFGVGHPFARAGDRVVVLLGAPVPFIIRDFPEGQVVIGECYVHGIMDGEAIAAKLRGGKAEHKEDFEQFRLI